jgi:CDP-glucose 4,6-dehydratase
MLARALYEEGAGFATAFNFGPPTDRHLPVRSIVEQMIAFWGDGASWQDCSNPDAPHEAGMLVLAMGR